MPGDETLPPVDISGSDQTWAADDPHTGDVPAQRYTQSEEIGRGALGIVERIHDGHLDRNVARKRMRESDLSERSRFVHEARLTASMAHPGIVPVYDLDVDGEGAPFYTMQEVVGEPWRTVLKSLKTSEELLAQLDVLLAVARAVAHAHERGIVHRDLKPANIMVGHLGDVWVVDWGLGIYEHEAVAGLAGTPQYMSPEQARGDIVDRRTDVWALGIMLHRLLTGSAAYTASQDSDVLALAKAGNLPNVEKLNRHAPPELIDIVGKATQKRPTDRYPDAGAFAADLKAFTQGHWVAAHNYTPGEMFRKVWREHRTSIIAVGVAATLVATSTVGAAVVTANERDRAVEAEATAIHQLASALEAQGVASEPDRYDARAEWAAASALSIEPDRPRARGVLVRAAASQRPRLLWSTPLACPAIDGGEGAVITSCSPRDSFITDVSPDGTLGITRLLPAATNQNWTYQISDTWVLRHSMFGSQSMPRDTLVASGVIRGQTTLWGQSAFHIDGSGAYFLESPTAAIDALPTLLFDAKPTLFSDAKSIYARTNYGISACTFEPFSCNTISERFGYRLTDANDGWVVAEHTQGSIDIIHHESGLKTSIPTDAGGFLDLVIAADHVCALRTNGDVEIWNMSGAPVVLLPTAANHATALAASGDRLWVMGDSIQAWELPVGPPPIRAMQIGGIAALGDNLVAAGKEELFITGLSERHSMATGNVVKSVDVDANGGVWFTTSGARDLPMEYWNPSTGERRQDTAPTSFRRMLTNGRGARFGMTYARELLYKVGAADWVTTPTQCWGDAARAGDFSRFICGDEGRLVEFDPTGRHAKVLAEHEEDLWAMAISSDGDTIAYATVDHTIHVLLPDTKIELGPDHDAPVASIAFSPDGRWLATASWDMTIHIYDLAEEHLTATLEGHSGRVVDLAFTKENELWSIGWDQTLRRWDLTALGITPQAHLDRIRRETGQGWSHD